MVIKEQGLLRAMKEAYKGTGYEIACKETVNGPEIYLKTGLWWVMCEMKNLPRKVLGLLAEHMGDLPKPGQALQVKKKECQTMIYEDALRSFQGITPEDCVNPANVRVIHIKGTISGVSIAPALPANEAERRVLEYLAGLNAPANLS